MNTELTVIKNLLTALHKVRGMTKPIPRTELNEATGTYYATLDQVQEALDPGLKKAKLLLLPNFRLVGNIMETSLTLFHVPSQESYTAHLPMPLDLTNPNAAGAAVTAARRILLCTIFNLRTPELTEGVPGTPPNPSRLVQKADSVPAGSSVTPPHAPQPSTADADEKHAAIKAMRTLQQVWLQASTSLGLSNAIAVLEKEFSVKALRQIPADQVVHATAILNLAMREATGSALPQGSGTTQTSVASDSLPLSSLTPSPTPVDQGRTSSRPAA